MPPPRCQRSPRPAPPSPERQHPPRPQGRHPPRVGTLPAAAAQRYFPFCNPVIRRRARTKRSRGHFPSISVACTSDSTPADPIRSRSPTQPRIIVPEPGTAPARRSEPEAPRARRPPRERKFCPSTWRHSVASSWRLHRGTPSSRPRRTASSTGATRRRRRRPSCDARSSSAASPVSTSL